MAYIRISKDKRAMILAALCEGMGVNGVCRLVKVSKQAMLRFLAEAGEACEDWHNRNFRDLTVEEIQLDEQWGYVGCHRERMTAEQKRSNPHMGDCWLWASIDPVSKAILNWRVGKRTLDVATAFAEDLADRVRGRVQITTDKLTSYKAIIPSVFAGRVDYAQEKKVFHKDTAPAHQWNRYSVNPLVGVERETVCGQPDMETATLAHVERLFLTVRQGNRRATRKTLGYSKKWENHGYMASVQLFIYNMVRRHETVKEVPAVVLGVISKRWTLEQVVAMVDSYHAAKLEAQFAAAFEGFTMQPKSRRTYESVPQPTPLTPWYLDQNSGGPNPPKEVRKDGIQYEE